jgi:2-succinyl-6-hydroxy-2,4-cyclohexadiene-1-carboxylate synthase
MFLKISGIGIYYEDYLNRPENAASKQTGNKNVILIHGFTGSSKDWEDIIPRLSKNFNYYAIDLPGHGNSDSPSRKKFYNTNYLVKLLREFTIKLKNYRSIFLGYSMGGRAALSYSVKFPDTVEGLILESSTAGIRNDRDRKERIKKDKELAEYIETHSIKEFIEYWMNQDIFNTQKRFSNTKLEKIEKLKLANNKTGLSNSLKGFGTGRMPHYFDELKNLKFKTLLISGNLDEKFSLINKQMADLLPSAEHVIIKNAGHNTHLETPDSFINIVNKFLDKFL